MAKKRTSSPKKSHRIFKKEIARRSLFHKNDKFIKHKPENALMHFARLEGIDRLTRKYENKNLSIDKTPKKEYNSLVLNLKTDKDVCRERKRRRKDIMRISKGNGFRVRFARWNPDSYIVCVK